MKHLKDFFKKNNIEYTVNDVVQAIKNYNIKQLRKVANKYNINNFVDFGTTVLNYAIYKNNHDIIDEVIKLGADINLPSRNRSITPLIAAAQYDDYRTIKKLLDLGANPYYKDIYNNYFIDYMTDVAKINIKLDYPELYNNYLLKKNIEKYNL